MLTRMLVMLMHDLLWWLVHTCMACHESIDCLQDCSATEFSNQDHVVSLGRSASFKRKIQPFAAHKYHGQHRSLHVAVMA